VPSWAAWISNTSTFPSPARPSKPWRRRRRPACPLIKYGTFIQAIVDFVIIAFAIFMAVKAINRLKRQEEAAPAEPPPTLEEVILLREIRDALSK
jgi:large conductance mechanosensitive channel